MLVFFVSISSKISSFLLSNSPNISSFLLSNLPKISSTSLVLLEGVVSSIGSYFSSSSKILISLSTGSGFVLSIKAFPIKSSFISSSKVP